MKGREKLWSKLSSTFLRKWWLVGAIAAGIILLGVIIHVFFMTWFRLILHSQIVLRPGSQTYELWSKPPVTPIYRVYIYNVTNADEFLNNGSQPIVDELGPYVYLETWEKVNLRSHDNGTITFNQKKIYVFNREMSAGSEDDVVVVPNIPMLSATSQSKDAARFLRLAMTSILDVLKVKPFVEVSVGQFLWGYEDPLINLAQEVTSKEHKLPYEEFGLMYNKNGTSVDNVTMYTGSGDITKFGLIDNVNGINHLKFYRTDECNSVMGSDGSLFPPHITKNTTLRLYDKDLCRLLHLEFSEEIDGPNHVQAYRFRPALNAFGTPDENPENACYYSPGTPPAPSGFINVSLCQYDSPIYLSFPHFYLANDSYRTRFQGISPPNAENHSFYMDVNPLMGSALAARGRIQINLAVSQVVDIKQVATFPDIIFPLIWFEESLDGLPEEVTNLMNLAATAPPIAKTVITAILILVGVLLLGIAIWRLFRGANRLSSLQLATGHVPPHTKPDIPMNSVK